MRHDNLTTKWELNINVQKAIFMCNNYKINSITEFSWTKVRNVGGEMENVAVHNVF